MRIDVVYRIYLGDDAYDFLTLEQAQDEQLWQQVAHDYSPLIYKVELAYVGEQYVGEHEEQLV